MRRPRFRFALMAVIATLLVNVAVLPWAPSLPTRWFSLLLQTSAAFGSSAVAVWAARRHVGAARRGWLWIGIGCAGWGCGALVWVYYDLLRQIETPYPGVADIGYLAFSVFVIAGAVALQAPARHVGAARVTLDAVVVAGSLLVVTWFVALQTLYAQPGTSLLAQWLGLAYPVSDVVALSIVVATFIRTPRSRRRPVYLLLTGLAAMTFADTGFAYTTTTDTYLSGGALDVGWVAAFLFIGLAAFAAVEHSQEKLTPAEGMSRSAVLAPYGPWLVAIVLILRRLLADGALDGFSLIAGAVLLLLVVARQVLTMLENVGLTHRLESAMADLGRSEEYYRMLVQRSSDVITVLEPSGRARYMSPAVTQLLGWTPEELDDRILTELVHPDDVPAFARAFATVIGDPAGSMVVESRAQTRERGYITLETVMTNMVDVPLVGAVVCNTRDISERKTFEQQLAHQAFHDQLTGLPNRALFRDRVSHALAQRQRHPHPVAVLFLDLDGFKAVNDTLGHAGGDELLRIAAQRIRSSVRDAETVARLGGDEFAVLLESIDGPDDARDVADRCLAACREQLSILGHQLQIGASIGIAIASGEESADDLLRNADLAMYRAKNLGKGRHVTFAAEMHAAVVRRLSTEESLRRAIDGGELTVHYQPLVSLTDGAISGVEALARWQHPERGMLLPEEFIDVAEESGLIVPLGRWVLEEATRTVGRWRAQHPDLTLSVNVSGRQLALPTFATEVRRTLAAGGLPAHALTLEITERSLVDLGDAMIARLRALRDSGVLLAIDDYGAGYSSINYLRRMPLDILKVDMSYVAGLGIDPELTSLTTTIVAMAQSLGLATVAEGIETQEQLRQLIALGCTTGQGFLLGRPLDASSLITLLSEPRPDIIALRDVPPPDAFAVTPVGAAVPR